jgi:hypothetical protein
MDDKVMLIASKTQQMMGLTKLVRRQEVKRNQGRDR